MKEVFLNLIVMVNFCSLFILPFLEKIAERALDTQFKEALDEVGFFAPLPTGFKPDYILRHQGLHL